MEEPDDQALDVSMESSIAFKLVMQVFGVVLLAILLSLIGGAAGWLVGGGMVSKGFNITTLMGSGIGFAIGTLLGCFTFGPGRSAMKSVVKKHMPPDSKRITYGLGMKTFSIYMTIHEIRNVSNSEGILAYFGKQNDSYLEVRVGRKLHQKDNFKPNYQTPVKRTCVQQDGKFDEVFKLNIEPRDDTIEVKLMDQDFAGDDTVGTADINISHEIIGEGFPQQKGYKIMHKDSVLWGGTMRKTGVVIISFDMGEDIPSSLVAQLKEQFPMEFARKTHLYNEQQREDNERQSLILGNSASEYGALRETQWKRNSQTWIS